VGLAVGCGARHRPPTYNAECDQVD
jgi:hypothetical protein